MMPLHAISLIIVGSIVAQVATDAVQPAAGWVGAGMLGGVLSWLLFVHLPAKDKQIAGLIDSRDLMVKELNASFRDGIVESDKRAAEVDRDRREDYRISLGMVVAHCEKEMATTSAAIRTDLGELARTMAEIRMLIKELRDVNPRQPDRKGAAS